MWWWLCEWSVLFEAQVVQVFTEKLKVNREQTVQYVSLLNHDYTLHKCALTEWCVLAVMVRVASVSQMTRSLSDPTAIRPLRGYRFRSFAALVLVTATNMFSSILPVTWQQENTHLDLVTIHLNTQSHSIRSSPQIYPRWQTSSPPLRSLLQVSGWSRLSRWLSEPRWTCSERCRWLTDLHWQTHTHIITKT